MRFLDRFISRRSLRTLLVLGTLCVSMPVIVLLAYLGREQYHAKLDETAGQAMNFAGHFAARHDDVLQHARTLLQVLVIHPELLGYSPEELSSQFQSFVKANPQYAYLTLVSPDGFLKVSSSSADSSINFKDREVFQEALHGKEFSVGQTIISRTTGHPVLPFAAPVRGSDGEVKAVLLLGYIIEEYNAFFAAMNLPPRGRAVLFNQEGRRLLRYPAHEDFPIGGQLNIWASIRDSGQDAGTFTAMGPEGWRTVYAFIKVWSGKSTQDYLGVLIALPEASWGSIFWPTFGRTMFLIFMVSLLAIVINIHLSRRIVSDGLQSLTVDAKAIGSNKYPDDAKQYAGCAEVAELGREFLAMASALRQNKKARDEAEDALLAEATRQRTLLESALDGIHVLDEAGNVVLCSPSFAQMLGYSLEEATKLNSAAWNTGFARNLPVGSVMNLMGESGRYETRFRRKDRSEIDVEVNSRAIILEGRALLYCSARDITQRKKNERLLRELEKSRRELVESAPIGIFRSTPEGRYVEVNAKLAAIYGYESARDLMGSVKNIPKQLYVDPEDRERLLVAAAHDAAQGVEQRRRRKDGAIIWVSTSLRAVREDDGSILHYEGFVRDITKRILAEQSLKDERMRLAHIIEGTHAGTWEWNVQSGETIFNERWAEIVGYTLDELAPVSIKTWEDLAHPEDLALSGKLLERHFSGELPYYDAECRMKHKDGRWVWVHDRGRLLSRDEHGRPLMMFGTHMDITSRKEAEAGLRESEQRYRATFEGLDAIKLIIDPSDGSIEDANLAAVLFYGYPFGKLRGKKIYEINTLPRETVLEELAKSAAQDASVHHFKHRLASGEVRDVESHVSTIRVRGEKRVISTIHDVTEIRRLEQVKEDVERIIRHDLKAPLTGIINIPLILLDEEGLNPDQREMLQLIAAAGRKMLHQLNSAQAMHKVEGGDYSLHREDCDPLGMLRDNISILAVSGGLDAKAFRVRSEKTGDKPLILKTDRLLLDVALMNLLRNAMEARMPGETVGVACGAAGEECFISIANRRPVPVEIRDRFFDKYATAGKAGGTGLGTYSAAIMVRALGGNISLETSDELGTKVTIRLPLTAGGQTAWSENDRGNRPPS